MSAVLQSLLLAEIPARLQINGRDVEITLQVHGRRYPGFIDVYRVLANGRDATDLLNDEGFASVFYDALYQR